MKNVCSPFQQLLQFKAPAQARAMVLSAVRERAPTSLHRAQLTCRTVHSLGSVRSPRNGPQGGTQHLADGRDSLQEDCQETCQISLKPCLGGAKERKGKNTERMTPCSACPPFAAVQREMREPTELHVDWRLLLGRRGGYPDPLRRYYL